MQVFIFQAALLCEACGEAKRAALIGYFRDNGGAPDDESSYDSDDFPKGPYREGGGEADTPQHCDSCNTFLYNPLTGDGYRYVREALDYTADIEPGDSEYTLSTRLAAKLREINKPVLAEWAEFYPEAFTRREGGTL